MTKRRWTEDERRVVREHYPDLDTKRLTEVLPDRSVGSIYDQAGRMGLKKSYERLREQADSLKKPKK